MNALKTILLLLLIPLTGFLGFIFLFAIGISGGTAIASYMTITTTIAIWIFITALVLQRYPAKTLWKYMGVYIMLCLLITAGCQVKTYYTNHIPVVRSELDLNPYKPFAENTKAVSLDSTSTLKLTERLPVMDGATALYPLYSAFTRATYPQKNYRIDSGEVVCTNTPNAYRNLVDGKADIIFVARPSKEQLEYADSKDIKLTLTPIGKEAFVFFVNSNNKINGLTLNQIKNIYSGSTRNWAEVGGDNNDIRAFQRPEGSGSQTMLIHIMQGTKLSTPQTNDRPAGMGGIIKETADYKNYGNAIGFSFLFYATEMVNNKEIKVLDIDGVKAMRKTIQDGTYPLTADFYAVTTTKAKPNTKKLIEWIIGIQGQALVEKTGYTPLL